jgi:hypothetical protein
VLKSFEPRFHAVFLREVQIHLGWRTRHRSGWCRYWRCFLRSQSALHLRHHVGVVRVSGCKLRAVVHLVSLGVAAVVVMLDVRFRHLVLLGLLHFSLRQLLAFTRRVPFFDAGFAKSFLAAWRVCPPFLCFAFVGHKENGEPWPTPRTELLQFKLVEVRCVGSVAHAEVQTERKRYADFRVEETVACAGAAEADASQ